MGVGLALLLPFCSPAQAATQAEGPGPLEKLRPPIKPSAPNGHLQELSPPLAVQQIQAVLADRQPRVTILAPADGTNLPNGNWTLKLLVQDWPLADGGTLGIGTHVVIQIDDQAPIRLTEHRSTPQGDSLQLTLPALTPGSHRITAYAAKPWGEAAKNSGAASQIRVDRVAANPLTVPNPGSPQLLPVSPLGVVSSEPVLLDWLLLDAPLQHLRDNDGSWRLRVSINWDTFITDQNLPIWLKGWTTGSNSLQLELLDGRGKPLNPPFNSLVSELVLKPSTLQPRWQQGRLSAEELASLVGQTPTPATPLPAKSKTVAPASAQPPEPSPQPKRPPLPLEAGEDPRLLEPAADGSTNALTQPPIVEEVPAFQEREPIAAAPESTQPESTQPESADLQPTGSAASLLDPNRTEADQGESASAKPDDNTNETRSEISSQNSGETPAEDLMETDLLEPITAVASNSQDNTNPAQALQPSATHDDEPSDQPTVLAEGLDASAGEQPTTNPGDLTDRQASGAEAAAIPPPIVNPDRLTPMSSVVGSARDQVRDDGSLIKPKRKGPLAGLRERLSS